MSEEEEREEKESRWQHSAVGKGEEGKERERVGSGNFRIQSLLFPVAQIKIQGDTIYAA